MTAPVAAADEMGEAEAVTEIADIWWQDISRPTGGVIYDMEEVPDTLYMIENAVYSTGDIQTKMNSTEIPDLLPDGSTRYGYNKLTSAQQEYYDEMLLAIEKFLHEEYTTENYTETSESAIVFSVQFSDNGLTMEDAGKTYYCLRNDFPELYWLWYGFAYSSTSLFMKIGADYYEVDTRAEMETAIEVKLQEYVDAVSGIADTYEVVRTVHDKLVTEVEYAYDSNRQPEDALWAHSIGGVVDGKNRVVCEGYAKMFQLVLNALNIPNIYIVGDAGGGHAWNAVQLEGEWYFVDPTWDDITSACYDGITYAYYCVPTSWFALNHTADSPNGSLTEWLYALPAMSDSMAQTFYTKYYCDFTGITSVTEASAQLLVAGKSVPGKYIHALTNSTTRAYVSNACGGMGYYTYDGGRFVGYVEAAQYKVQNPATDVRLTGEKAEINRDESNTMKIKAVMTSASGTCDDILRWTVTGDGATIKPASDSMSATLTVTKNGNIAVTATAVIGKVSATWNVNVTGSVAATPTATPTPMAADAVNIYMDSGCSEVPDTEDVTIWVNGGNVGATKASKYNYKARTMYTSIRPSKIVTVDKKGKEKTQKGKLVAGITMTNVQPAIVKNKIVDTAAAKIAKATVNAKTGLIKVTAQKEPGTVYLWVIDTGDEKAVAFAKINVTVAPAKIVTNCADYTTADREVLKKATMKLGSTLDVYLEPLVKNKSSEIAEDSTFYVTYGKGSEDYVEAVPIAGTKYGFRVRAKAMDTSKPGKSVRATVNFVCTQNNKKATVSIVIINLMDTITYSPGNGITGEAGGLAFTVPVSETDAKTYTLNFETAAEDVNFESTDKVKIYTVSSPDGISIDYFGKVKVTRPKGAAAKIKAALSKDKRNITIKVPKGLEAGIKSYFFLYYNPGCYEVFSIETVAEGE